MTAPSLNYWSHVHKLDGREWTHPFGMECPLGKEPEEGAVEHYAPQERAKDMVRAYITGKLEKTDPVPQYDVYVVWFTFTLGNWKALVSTSLPDGMYYEVTHNAAKRETYIDAYKKFDNVCVPD